jgi:ABC-type nitrate/sulfonate/bicarbonate transport system substrate-binding protein
MFKSRFAKLGAAGFAAIAGVILIVSSVGAHQAKVNAQGGLTTLAGVAASTQQTGTAADQDVAELQAEAAQEAAEAQQDAAELAAEQAAEAQDEAADAADETETNDDTQTNENDNEQSGTGTSGGGD